jgi:hypothetical protein
LRIEFTRLSVQKPPGSMPDSSANPTLPAKGSGLAEALGLKRNLVLLLVAIVLIGSGEEMWMRFVPKYLQALGAGVLYAECQRQLRIASAD